MGHNNREVEVKLSVTGMSLDEINVQLRRLFSDDITRELFGSSIDTYWTVHTLGVDADFIRMRERDGIRQITVKGKDRGTNLDRMEIDIDSTSDVATVRKLLNAVHGSPRGTVNKTYYVYWLDGSKHTTVCCYQVTNATSVRNSVVPPQPDYGGYYIEVETTNSEKMLALETKVLDHFIRLGISIQRAAGSLYEMYIEEKQYE